MVHIDPSFEGITLGTVLSLALLGRLAVQSCSFCNGSSSSALGLYVTLSFAFLTKLGRQAIRNCAC